MAGDKICQDQKYTGLFRHLAALCSSPIWDLDTLFINENLSLHEQLVKLNTIAIHQMRLLTDDTGIRKIP
jgi:hypothetical protein